MDVEYDKKGKIIGVKFGGTVLVNDIDEPGKNSAVIISFQYYSDGCEVIARTNKGTLVKISEKDKVEVLQRL